MYVCLCHGLNERAVHEARDHGASTAKMVYGHHGVKPKCGKCTGTIMGMVGTDDSGGGCGRCTGCHDKN